MTLKFTPLTEGPARHGWTIRSGPETRRVIVAGVMGRVRVETDDSEIVLPRSIRGPITREVPLSPHTATIERWTAFKPIRQWVRSAGLGRASALDVIVSFFSAAVGAGVAAAMMRPRAARLLYRLTVDGKPAGTWIFTWNTEHAIPWVFVPHNGDLAAAVADWEGL
jgi:hypothetical protein